MKSYALPTLSVRFSVLLGLFLALLLPFTTSAASTRPTCELSVKTEDGIVSVKKDEDVLLVKGGTVEIKWQSKNAEKASRNGESISLSGTATETPGMMATYSYRFTAGSKQVTCAVTVHVVTGNIKESTLTSKSSKPTLSGEVEGTKSVRVRIYKEGSERAVYTSKVIRVKNGDWKARVSKRLTDGVYDVVLSGDKNFELNTIARETLTIGEGVTSTKGEEKSDTTIVVVPVPLLLGGTARGGASVSVSYLQVINLGKEPASLTGFSVKQNGSARAESVIGFTAVDDTGIVRGSVGGTEGVTPFKNGVATVPVNFVLPAGQMRLFTIKAVLGKNVAPYLGTQLKIDVTGVKSTATVRNAFPIRGTTWTIGL